MLYPEKRTLVIDEVEYSVDGVNMKNGNILISSKTLWDYMGIEMETDEDTETIILRKQ